MGYFHAGRIRYDVADVHSGCDLIFRRMEYPIDQRRHVKICRLDDGCLLGRILVDGQGADAGVYSNMDSMDLSTT